ncbi:MAG: hypothetical protein ABR585_00180 [Gemmatimonadaceae bacterium]
MIQPTTQSPSRAPRAIVAQPGAGNPAAIYQGYRAQRRELTNQLDELENTRANISSQLEEVPSGSAERKALESRMSDVDQRIVTVDGMLAANAVQLSQAAAVPGAVVESPRIVRQGPPDEAFVLGGLFMLVTLLPLSVAFARRIWRRSATTITSLPRDLADRLSRMEHSIEATSLEVERIGEGQRFLTRLFTEGENARAIGTGTPQSLQRKPTNAPDRIP